MTFFLLILHLISIWIAQSYNYNRHFHHLTRLSADKSLPSTVDNQKDFDHMTVMELRSILKNIGIKSAGMKKSDLVDVCKKTVMAAGEFSTTASESKEIAACDERDGRVNQTLESGKAKLRNLFPNVIPVNNLITPNVSKSYRPLFHGKFNSSDGSNPNRFPVGYLRDNRFQVEDVGEMDVTFLGTASCIPTVTRGVSCAALRYKSDTFLFDCGESTQIQMQRSRLKISRIKKIFITHTHGDHLFGLPGLLCLIGQSHNDERIQQLDKPPEPIDVYGPEGLRDYIRASLQMTYSRIAVPYRVHELMNVPFLHDRCVKRPPSVKNIKTSLDPNYRELPGTQIYPDKFGIYNLFDDGKIAAAAAPMQHTVPCVGYVMTEHSRPGRLNPDLVTPLIEENFDELKKLDLIGRNPIKVLAYLKTLKPGQVFTFPNGKRINVEDVVEPPMRGRKVVFMGDTCSGDMIAPIAKNADLLVHEATNAWVPDQDAPRFPTYESLERETFIHGHSTPEMAGRFAAKIQAKKLVLTHFSSRYLGDESEFSMRLMWRLEDMARTTSMLTGANDVIAAWDFMQVSIPLVRDSEGAGQE